MTFSNPVWFLALVTLLPFIYIAMRGQNPATTNSLILSIGFIVVGLAGPELGVIKSGEKEHSALFLAIDASKSMKANDITPSRLTRAKIAARLLLESLPEEPAGLIVFAGDAWLQVPLTMDRHTIYQSIENIDPDNIPRVGSHMSAPISLAITLFEQPDSGRKSLVLFSDGETTKNQDIYSSIKSKAIAANLMVTTVGVGSEAGSILVNAENDKYVKDKDGNVIMSRLNPKTLKGLTSCGGKYIPLNSQTSVHQTVQLIKANLESKSTIETSRDKFFWPFGLALICLIFSTAFATKDEP